MKNDYRYTDDQNAETRDWLDALDDVIARESPERVRYLLRRLQTRAHTQGIRLPFSANTPYMNTIAPEDQPPYPGDIDTERRIRSIIRWNAMAMVVRANRNDSGVGGHISSYASAASLYEMGFNHFFRGRGHPSGGDYIYFQGHSAPGIYARAFLEGRLSEEHLGNFRRENAEGGGLSSYPHPRLMPKFWEFPTVSMGLGPIAAIYHARFIEYLHDRGLKPYSDSKVWAFLGDGETDEPESLGAITLASREKLDNLIFVINCNLQRLDGPVRGNGKIIQELEAIFRGAGWNVIKVIWGSDWDPFIENDHDGRLVARMGEIVDGEYQKYVVESGDYIRKHFVGDDKELARLFKSLSDGQLRNLRRGGHDSRKIHPAFKAAIEHKGSPTVILAKTIKGYGLGEGGEGKNITHQQKKLNEDELREFRTRFGIPISDDDVGHAPFYRPPEDSPEMKYLHEHRETLGGYLPARRSIFCPMEKPPQDLYDEFFQGTKDRAVSTTMVFVRILSKLLDDKEHGKLIVPIVPDEARTFGMEALFRKVGIYAHAGQLYEPVDADNLLYYKEAQDGQILEEGLNEAGSMSSFIAAGSAYSMYGINAIPFYIYYSMFGFQRIGDLIWMAGDMQCKGFLVGGTAGRTTLNGEGLQHQDGHSHLLAYPVPNIMAYDPAFAFEIAVIIRDGIRRMYKDGENIFYYLTVENENYIQPPMPEGVEEGILKGMYKFRAAPKKHKLRAQILGSGAMMNHALQAQELLSEKYKVAADVWSVTSYKELHRDAMETERWNLLHPGEEPRKSYIAECFEGEDGVIVATSDYVKALPESIAQAFGRPVVSLGTDGYGRSESRENLRDWFEVDYRFVTLATLSALAREAEFTTADVLKAIKALEIDVDKTDPMSV